MMFTEVYRSNRLADCEQRAFVLHAMAIGSQIITQDEVFVLLVHEQMHANALSHLQTYDAESRIVEPPPAAPVKTHPHAWIGSLGYCLVMLATAYSAGAHLLDVDWRAAGALRGSLAQSHEWWRIVTALTLHADVGHLLANLAFGVFFGYFAGQMLGPGVAWLSILVAASLGNFLDSVLMPSQQMSIGASTAVFATLGLVAALSWQRSSGRLRWAQRTAPLIAGIALLAFTGTGGENTDVVAHATGFISGIAFGVVYSRWPMERLAGLGAQLAAGTAAIAAIVGAWAVALL